MMDILPSTPIEHVVIHQPVTFIKHQSQGESNVKLISRTLANTDHWRRIDSTEFAFLHDYSKCLVLKYSRSPPVVRVSSTKHDKRLHSSKDRTPAWCMSSLTEGNAKETRDNSSPTDFLRYKTKIIIQANRCEIKKVWKQLQKSLQKGELDYCNAYFDEPCDIVLYHYGCQQAQIGEWIWKNISVTYSKKTCLVNEEVDYSPISVSSGDE